MSTIINSPPILQVPSLLWGGGSNTTNLYKVPFHTFGTAKKRYLRIKPYNDDDGSAQSVEIALFDNKTDSKRYYIVKAEYPLKFIWSDPTTTNNNNNESTTTKSLLSSPLFVKKKNYNEQQNELLIDDIIEIVKGNSSSAFQAYIAKNGSNSIPNTSCCFSLVTEERSVDFFVQSDSSSLGLNDNEEGDVQLASALIDSIQTLLDNFHNRKNKNTNQHQQQQHQLKSITSPTAIRTMQQFDATLHSKLLFQAARASDIGSLRYYFDIKGCPVDFMDNESGDTVLIIACRLGLFDVARLALLGYNAKNDPHPTFGQTALQVAVSSGHTDIIRLILQTAERSNADTIIVNHEDSSQEAPVHVASRIGSLDILELLVEHGANLGLVDGRGRTCLHCSAQSGQDECLLFILDNLADEYLLEVRCYEGYTPLHVAVRSNKIECVKVLLQAGADVTAESSNGRSCFNMASKQRSDRIMQLLLEYDVSDQDSYDSYNDQDDESSVDMFRGLNQFDAASPASTNQDYHNVGSPYNGGTLVSPTNQSSMNYINRLPLCTAGAVSLPSVFTRGEQISHSPVRVNNQLSSLVCNNNATYSSQQRQQYGGEFYHEGCVWKIYATHDGHTYFYNEKNNYSTWEDPRLSVYAASPSRSPLVSRNVGQNHYQQQTTPTSYTKKLTAIPSPVATRTRPSSAASILSSYKAERSMTNQNHEPNTDTTNTSQSVEVQYQPLQSGGSKSTATASLPLQSQHDAVEPTTIQGRSTLSPNILTSSIESGASEGIQGKAIIDSKQLLLDQIKSRSEKKEQADPKSMLLAHIKSRASSQDDLLASSKLTSPSTKSMNDNVQADSNNTKSMLLAQIKSRGSNDDHSTQSTPLSTKSSTVTTDGSSNNDPELARYIKMKSVGLPSAAVLHKMEMDKVDASKIKLFRAQLDKQSATVAADNSTKIEQTPIISPKRQSKDKLKQVLSQDEDCKKYLRAVSVGVPAEAVAHKMKVEGVDATKVQMFKEYHSLAKDSLTTNTTTPARTLSTSKQQQQTPMEKYANLTEEDLIKDDTFDKYRKMKGFGVPLMAIVASMSRDGVDKDKIQMFSCVNGLVTSAAKKRTTTPHRRRASKALQKIHWQTVAEVENSLWANPAIEDVIDDKEISRLEELFAKSPKKSGVKLIKKDTKKQMNNIIDPKRANNISISLAQFRAFANFDDLCRAVVSLDCTHLSTEKLTNMTALLPRPDELKLLKNVMDHDDLGRAEQFFLSVMKVPRFHEKLNAFRYSLVFDEQVCNLKSSLCTLEKACIEIKQSKKLADILHHLLTYGNLMNESTNVDKAKGITLDSLVETALKKGNDRSTTMIDLVLSLKYEKQLDKIDFWSEDMPSVRDAMRLDLDDLQVVLRSIQSETNSVKLSIEAEKKDKVESQEDNSSREYLSKLEPFIKKANDEIESIKSIFDRVEGKVGELCSFFAEDYKTCKASKIFKVLLEFSRIVEKSKEKHIRIEKANTNSRASRRNYKY